LLIGLVDGLLWVHWKRGKQTGGVGRWLAIAAFGIVPLLSLAGFGFFGYWVPDAQEASVYKAFSLFLTLFLLIYLPKITYLLVYGTGRLLNIRALPSSQPEQVSEQRQEKPVRKRHYPPFSRRKFLSQVGIVMATAPFITLLFGVLKGRYAFYSQHVRLSFPNLPEAFDGLRVVQISDLHLGSFGSNRAPLQEAIELINNEHPDLILFTGDLVNNFAGETNGWDDVFKALKAPLGMYSILGNHDYGDYSKWPSVARKEANFRAIVSANERFGFRVLRNQSVMIEKEGQQLALSGVENWGRPPFPQYGDLSKTWQEVAQKPFKILMTHDPDHWEAQVLGQKDYDLTLSGHTHGMQFGLQVGNYSWSPAQYKFKRWAGLYREGNQFLYVNRGLGYLGMPARVGMPPEITVFELSRGPVGTEPM
jgi:predicted MPP superfamily phosphohydrolase